MHPLAGRKQSSEHIAKRVAAWKVSTAPQKNRERLVARNKAQIGKPRSQEQIEKHRSKMMGRSTAWLKGRKLSDEHRRNLAAYWASNPEKHNHYIDGRADGNQADRRRVECRIWREKVFARDNWTCIQCGLRGGKLNADHILPWARYPELRYDLDNGRTLCVPCHRATPTFAGRVSAAQHVGA